MAEPVDELEESDECESVLTEESYDSTTPPPQLRSVAALIRLGNADALHHALDNLDDHIDEPVEEGYTALHVATMEGQLSCVKLLLNRGANLEADFTGITPLHCACFERGFTEIAQLLLQSANSPECLKRMLEAYNMVGNTPLHFAAKYDHADIVRLLLDSGASPTMKNDYGKTPIDMAKPDSETRRILEAAAESDEEKNGVLEYGSPNYFSDPENPTAPHLRKLAAVIRCGNADALCHALDKLNDSIDEPLHNGLSALHLAVRFGHLSCVEVHVRRGANLEVHLEGVTPLHYACGYGGNTEIAQFLLQNAKNPECLKRMLEAVDMDGDTALHFAARHDYVDTIRLLLDAGASPTKTNRFMKQTPIDMAKPGSEARRILEAAARAKT